MTTRILRCDDAGIALAAQLLKEGQLVAFPTETVYGLGADARSNAAALRVFAAKDRPADNPLITHVAENEQVEEFAADVPSEARRLMQVFWPGALTLVLRQKPGALPPAVTAGLSTFAVRRPSHPAAARLIRESGIAVAAPSANRSGRPSPTTAQHVFEDMEDRIPLILDGGPCAIGLESTVVSVLGGEVTLLRPGGVTLEMLREALPGQMIHIARGVDMPVEDGETVLSPGMKHRHYAPRARMAVVDGEERLFALYDEEAAAGGRPVILSKAFAQGGRLTLALGERPEGRLFAALRQADTLGATLVLFQAVPPEGVGYALMNRALRAAGFHREG